MSLAILLDRYLARRPEDLAVADHFRLLLRDGPRALLRSRLEGHLTASAWVRSADRARVVLVHHKKLGLWLQPGGHADGDPDLAAVARREVAEETGLTDLVLRDDVPLDLDVHRIPARPEAPAHLHFDVRFLFDATGPQALRCSPESHAVRWFTRREIERSVRDESVRRLARRAAEA